MIATPALPTRSVTEHDESFGSVLRFYREDRGLRRSALAARAGVDASYITHIEHGNRMPSLSVLNRIADALELGPRERIDLISVAGYRIGATEWRNA